MLVYKKNFKACLGAAFSIFALFLIFMNAKQNRLQTQHYTFPEYNITGKAPIEYYTFPEMHIYANN